MNTFIKLFAGILFFLFSYATIAQTVLNRAEKRSIKNDRRTSEIPIDQLSMEQCGFEQAMANELAMPNAMPLSEREAAFNEYMKTSYAGKMDGEITVIPVVVHVVHLGEAEGVANNISDAQIFSAIQQLNDRFRKTPGTHGDADGVDTEIEFCLASIDPDGNPTDGIVRVDGSSVTGYSTGGVCVSSATCVLNELAMKNLSRWSNTEYYNIWVVSEIMDNDGGYGIQGYAYLPGSSSLYDGTVIMNTCFGSLGTVNTWNNLGRTLTHEIGHAMGLYHSFEGDNGGASCPTGNGDYVSDTDPHKRSSSNCPTGTNSCTGTTSQDVVHNYMDYSNQTCANMYFQGQADRMIAQISYWRSSLASSTTCTIDSQNDLAITQIVNDQDYQCSSSYTPIVSVYNLGSNDISSITFDYSYDGGTLNSFTWNNLLSSGDSIQISLPMQALTYAPHSFEVTATPDIIDDVPANNSISISFETLNKDPYSLEVVLDNYGSENSWEVLDANLEVLAFGGPYSDGQTGLTINESVCFPDGCNQFVFYESYGDGMGSGSYVFNDDNGVEVASGWSSPPASSFPTPMFESNSIEGPETMVSASDETICPGSSVVLTASGGSSYLWSTNQTGSSITVNPTVNTSYSVTASANGCTGSEAMVSITILPEPVAIVSPMNPQVCEGESITLTASGGSSYSWSNGSSGSTVVLTPMSNMSISVIPTGTCVGEATTADITVTELPTTVVSENNLSICEGSTITLIASGGEDYLWNTGSDSAEMTVAPSNTTTYSVTAYNASCPGNTENIVLEVTSAPFAGISTELTLCSGEGNQNLIDNLAAADMGGQWYDPNGSLFSGSFNPQNDVAGDYLYVVQGSGTCEDASAVLSISVDQQPNAGISTSISVNINSTDVDLIDYLAGADEGGVWTDPNGDAFDGFFNPLTNVEGDYSYSFNPDPPCNSSYAVVSVIITGSSNAGQSTSVYFCSTDPESNLFPLLMGADVGGYWINPEGFSFNGIIDPQNDLPGDYVYTIGTESATVTVNINETPEALIVVSDENFEVNELISFNNEGTNSGNYLWDFKDGTTSNIQNPTHSYITPGYYNVDLTIEDGGCVGFDTQGILITDINSGLTEQFIDDNLIIYPNPGFGLFKIRFNFGDAYNVRYDVINSNGQLISTSGLEKVAEATYNINLLSKSNGFYFLKFYVDDIIVVKKLLKTN